MRGSAHRRPAGLVAERGCSQMYWQTQKTSATARRLYDDVAAYHCFIVYTKELR
jgi:hypothetical protein